jgi:hypothetical protein
MKKYLVIFSFIFLLISNVKAEWIEVGNIEQPDGKMYLDIKTLSDDGEYLYIWSLKDWKKPVVDNGKSILSGKTFHKIDCNLIRSAGVQYIFYEGQMGTGKFSNFQRDKLKWNYLPPGTIMGNIIKTLCDNR